MTSVEVYSKEDIRKIANLEVKNRFYRFERLLNSLKVRIVDIEKILEYLDKKIKENTK